eukprot:scaffold1377_cov126-Cylindrotheca_fusiformis.AAC.20
MKTERIWASAYLVFTLSTSPQRSVALSPGFNRQSCHRIVGSTANPRFQATARQLWLSNNGEGQDKNRGRKRRIRNIFRREEPDSVRSKAAGENENADDNEEDSIDTSEDENGNDMNDESDEERNRDDMADEPDEVSVDDENDLMTSDEALENLSSDTELDEGPKEAEIARDSQDGPLAVSDQESGEPVDDDGAAKEVIEKEDIEEALERSQIPLHEGTEDAGPQQETPQESGWFSFLRRKKPAEQDSTVSSIDSDQVSATDKKVSELVVSFPDNETPTPMKQEKKKKSLLRRSIRYVVLVVAVLIATPFINGELGDMVTVQPSAKMRTKATIDEEPTFPTEEPEIDEDSLALDDSLNIPPPGEEETVLETPRPTDRKSGSSNSLSLSEKRQIALSFVTDVVHDVGPSVVRVDTETQMKEQSDSSQLPGYIQQGQGSGLIFSDKGYILTNAHVVDDANKVTVTLTDGRVYNCKVMGTDEIVDVAVLKIMNDDTPFSDLPVAELGDSDALSVGKIVIAVGSPGGLDNTVTMGIVSGLERSSAMVGIPHKKVDYIQTDAAINPGNSGGPLIDVESGRVVGINAAIRAHMEGTSFAIPINRIRDIMHDLSEGRPIEHGYLGLGLATCTPNWARQNNKDGSGTIPEVYGAIIHNVFPKTPAEKGGLKENDIILQIGETKVLSSEDARRLIDLAPVGKDITITVLRQQKNVELTVRPVDLAERLREIRKERQQQMQRERLRFEELGPFRSMLQ